MKKFLLRVIKELHLSLWERGVGGGSIGYASENGCAVAARTAPQTYHLGPVHTKPSTLMFKRGCLV